MKDGKWQPFLRHFVADNFLLRRQLANIKARLAALKEGSDKGSSSHIKKTGQGEDSVSAAVKKKSVIKSETNSVSVKEKLTAAE